MTAPAVPTLREARRRLAFDMLGIVVSSGAFGVVFGLARLRRPATRSSKPIAMSTIVFAGAAQFAAVGLVVAGDAVAGDRPPDRAPQRPPCPVLGGPGAVAPGRVAASSGRRWPTS